jgi:peroxiredoxin
VRLTATNNSTVDISSLPNGLTVIFCYPRTGGPNETIPETWNAIPGARGCTPQACAFRDALSILKSKGVGTVFGLSTQSTKYQVEVKQRLHLPYEILSDERSEFVTALKLPTIDWEGRKLVRRITLAIENGIIVKVWYPVFPSNKSAEAVMEWLESDNRRHSS